MMGWWATNGQNVQTLPISAAATWLAFGFNSDQAKTLNTVRLYLNAVAGTPAASELTCDLYNDSGAGIPGTSIESHPADSVPASGNWMGWSGFTTALTAGTQYWLVFKNANALPGTNFPTYQWIGAAANPNQSAMPLGAGGNYNAQGVMYGWSKVSSGNSGTTWGTNITSSVAGIRVGFSDTTYDGMPIQNSIRSSSGTTADRTFGKQETGIRFNVPAGVTLNVRGVWMPLTRFGTPGNLRFRIYQGVTLLGTTNAIPFGNVATTAPEGYTAYFPSSLALVSTSQPYRVVMSDATAADTSANGYSSVVTTWENAAASLALKPMNATLQKTITTDNTASPVVFTDTATDTMPFALLLDTLGEFTAAAGGGGIIRVTMNGGCIG